MNCDKCDKKITKGSQDSTIAYLLGETWCKECANADYEACETREQAEAWPFRTLEEKKRRWKP